MRSNEAPAFLPKCYQREMPDDSSILAADKMAFDKRFPAELVKAHEALEKHQTAFCGKIDGCKRRIYGRPHNHGVGAPRKARQGFQKNCSW
jgi:hypothetical protein